MTTDQNQFSFPAVASKTKFSLVAPDGLPCGVTDNVSQRAQQRSRNPPQAVLPDITAAGRIKELADAITTYGDKDKARAEKQTEAGKILEAIKANVSSLAKLRRQAQLADQPWPWRTPGVATIRKAFLLSPDRPMKD